MHPRVDVRILHLCFLQSISSTVSSRGGFGHKTTLPHWFQDSLLIFLPGLFRIWLGASEWCGCSLVDGHSMVDVVNVWDQVFSARLKSGKIYFWSSGERLISPIVQPSFTDLAILYITHVNASVSFNTSESITDQSFPRRHATENLNRTLKAAWYFGLLCSFFRGPSFPLPLKVLHSSHTLVYRV